VTRLSRAVWWAVLATAGTGLLLSLVVLVRAPAAPPPVTEVTGTAAVEVDQAPRLAAERRAATTRSRSRIEAPRTEARRAEARRADAAPRPPRRVVRPARVVAPSVDLGLDVVPVGVDDGGQMRLPEDPRVLGWYRYGPAPGAGAGSAVLAGHVDSREYGVGPLARLGGIRPGARIEVVLETGRRAAYRVDSIQRFDRQALPEAVFGRTGPERLRLVTCTGPYLPDAGGYQQNLVVTAVPVTGRV
jgi:hypothetical protein